MNLPEQMLENIAKLIFSKLPPDTIEKIGDVARFGVELKTQLERIEARIIGVELALQMLAKAAQTPEHTNGYAGTVRIAGDAQGGNQHES